MNSVNLIDVSSEDSVLQNKSRLVEIYKKKLAGGFKSNQEERRKIVLSEQKK